MKAPFFFGYGSLVNRATHDYPNAALATANGWRRAWVQTVARDFAYLSAVPAPGHSIKGLIAAVPNGDWDALDAREAAYDRLDQTARITHSTSATSIALYSVPKQSFTTSEIAHPILLSYLDVVLQGYLQEFGTEGVSHFVSTTDGWATPILNDRANPLYPRHQQLSPQELHIVDECLANLDADIKTI